MYSIRRPGLIFLSLAVAFLASSAGCIDSSHGLLTPETTTTPVNLTSSYEDNFQVFVQINESLKKYTYSDLKQQHYAMIPVLISWESPEYTQVGKPCWSENITETMDAFLKDPSVRKTLREEGTILGLDYYIQTHCANPICPPCEGEGPELHILVHNTTERFILMNNSMSSPNIKGPFF